MSGAAARNREYRSRQKAGRTVLPVEVEEIGLIKVLQRNGFLQSSDPSREEFSAALEHVIALWIAEEL
jgi:hypothetical protein